MFASSSPRHAHVASDASRVLLRAIHLSPNAVGIRARAVRVAIGADPHTARAALRLVAHRCVPPRRCRFHAASLDEWETRAVAVAESSLVAGIAAMSADTTAARIFPDAMTGVHVDPSSALAAAVWRAAAKARKQHHHTASGSAHSLAHHHPLRAFLEHASLYIVKIYLELCGHSGKDIPKTGSFVQCVWLPRLLGISLYTQDHDAPHRFSNGNFGKRFTLWDRVFGTLL